MEAVPRAEVKRQSPHGEGEGGVEDRPNVPWTISQENSYCFHGGLYTYHLHIQRPFGDKHPK